MSMMLTILLMSMSIAVNDDVFTSIYSILNLEWMAMDVNGCAQP